MWKKIASFKNQMSKLTMIVGETSFDDDDDYDDDGDDDYDDYDDGAFRGERESSAS